MKRKNTIEVLLEERNRLANVIRKTEKRLQRAPEGSVRVIRHGNGVQFYLRKGSDTSGVYMPAADREKAISLLQKRYDYLIAKAAKEQLNVIERFLNKYDPDKLKEIYESLPEFRRSLITPEELSDQAFLKQWSAYDYEPKAFQEGSPEHYTSSGERVRSKSEVMIADALKQAGIPYRYECPLQLGNMTIHPDFCILRVRDRETLYWEHLGMMDDPEYCNNAIHRIRCYEYYGIYPGINLILSMETSQIPINTAVIRKLIDAYCI